MMVINVDCSGDVGAVGFGGQGLEGGVWRERLTRDKWCWIYSLMSCQTVGLREEDAELLNPLNARGETV
jgi:hypothetical protein